MLNQWYTVLQQLIGDNPVEQLSCIQMISRGLFIYVYGILLVRIHKRFFGLKTSYDILLRVTIGSIFANIIIGRAPFFCSIAVTFILVGCNWVAAILAYRSHTVEKFIKGSHYLLVENGNIIWKNMHRFYITKDELLETARITAHTVDLAQIEKAYLENHGAITIILKTASAKLSAD